MGSVGGATTAGTDAGVEARFASCKANAMAAAATTTTAIGKMIHLRLGLRRASGAVSAN